MSSRVSKGKEVGLNECEERRAEEVPGQGDPQHQGTAVWLFLLWPFQDNELGRKLREGGLMSLICPFLGFGGIEV